MKLNMRKEAPPLYIQVKLDLKKKIEEGIWEVGDKIPNELELCKIYNVSRTTIRDAINELVWEEYLVRKRAKGTYVLKPKETELIQDTYCTEVRSFTHEMEELGHKAVTLNADVSLIQADEKIARSLKVEVGEEVFLLKRLRGAENQAVVFFKTYMQNNLGLSLDSKDYYGSLYEMLSAKGVTITKIKEYLEAGLPDQEVQEVLGIGEGVPVLKRIRTTYSDEDFVEYTEGNYIGDRYRYYVDLKAIR